MTSLGHVVAKYSVLATRNETKDLIKSLANCKQAATGECSSTRSNSGHGKI